MMRYTHWCVAGVFLAASAWGLTPKVRIRSSRRPVDLRSVGMELRSRCPDTELGEMGDRRQV